MPKVEPFDDTSKPQAEKFAELARELEADEDPQHFEETVRKIAPRAPAEKGDASES